MFKPYLIFLIIVFIAGCRKDPQLSIPIVNEDIYCFEQSSHLAPEPVLEELMIGEVTGGPYYTNLSPYYIYSIQFNPEKANQIAYIKQDTGVIANKRSIWFYDFCTKESRLLVEGCYNDLSWGNGDNILYIGPSYEVYSTNLQGISKQITTAGTHQTPGKYSPNGNLLFTIGSDGLRIFDKTAELLIFHEGYPNFRAIDWIDNDHLIIMNNTTSIYQSFNIHNSERVNLHTQPKCHYCRDTYVRESSTIYYIQHSLSETKGLYSFNIAKDEERYLKELSSSYELHSIDYNTDAKKLIFTLIEFSMKDPGGQNIYIRFNGLILNENATNPRIIDLPQ